MAIQLSTDARVQALASIKRYFEENMDEPVGDLKAALLIDYFLREIAPTIYNQAITDAGAYFQERVGDLDGSCHEPEFGYWEPRD